jgi:hypothetical protein
MARFIPGRDTEEQLTRLLNRGLTFADNVQGGFVEFSSVLGSNTIHHNLGFIPIGWVLIYQDDPVTFYAETPTLWTKEIMYLNASVASVTVRLFVM